MRLLADEGIERSVVEALRSLGFDVLWIAERQSGLHDQQVLQMAQQEGRILITYDKDFGTLVFTDEYEIPGVVLLRLHGSPAEVKATLICEYFSQFGNELSGYFTVVTPRGIRRRPLRLFEERPR